LGKASSASAGVIAYGFRDLRLEGNVIWGARYHLRLFGCRDVLVKNNTMAGKSVVTVQIGATGLPHQGVRFVNNLLYEDRSFRNGFMWIPGAKALKSDYNLFYTTNSRLKLAVNQAADWSADDLSAWRKLSGQDEHSLAVDPMVVDAKERDFRLRPGSPAVGAGQGGENIGALGVAR
jgi:hypothetical protein